MLDFILIPTVVGIITLGIYKLFELFARKKERILLIEKFSNNPDGKNSDCKYNFSYDFLPQIRYGALKVACLLIGIGLGLLTGFIVHYYITDCFSKSISYEINGVIYGAPLFICGGLGLLLAFILEKKFSKKQ